MIEATEPMGREQVVAAIDMFLANHPSGVFELHAPDGDYVTMDAQTLRAMAALADAPTARAFLAPAMPALPEPAEPPALWTVHGHPFFVEAEARRGAWMMSQVAGEYAPISEWCHRGYTAEQMHAYAREYAALREGPADIAKGAICQPAETPVCQPIAAAPAEGVQPVACVTKRIKLATGESRIAIEPFASFDLEANLHAYLYLATPQAAGVPQVDMATALQWRYGITQVHDSVVGARLPDAPVDALHGFPRDDLEAIADSLEMEPATVNVGPVDGDGDVHLPSTTAVAARFIRAALSRPQATAPVEAMRWPKSRDVKRREDMGEAQLRVVLDDDNDVIAELWEPGKRTIAAEFCNGGSGGGQSPKTRMALIALMVAMEEDAASAGTEPDRG
jgi:hypothetical protein